MDGSVSKLPSISIEESIKKASWLTSSTYKPVKLVEYESDEKEKEINYNAIIESDSGDDINHSIRKKRKEKRRRHKKVMKKKEIIKLYLNGIVSIDDEQCKFRKMIFVEELPRDERPDAFFLDKRGNPYISQYGSICEKHVPKHRSQKKATLSSMVSDRYYMAMKGLLSQKGQSPTIKKDCDSHCTCKQSFIPVPYDIIVPETQPQASNDQEMIDEVTAINEKINEDPHNIDAWLSLISVQSKSNQMGISSSMATSIVVEKRLMIVERAISKNQSNLQLHLLRMSLGGELWPLDKVQKEWNQLLFIYNTDINVWKFYIDQIAKKTLGFSVDKVIAIYVKCFSTFFNVMSGRMKTKTVDCDTVMGLCDLFADYCDYLFQSGYSERSLASWQAVIEYNLFCGPVAPKQSGNLLDDPMLRSLQDYWSMCPQHIGQPNSLGWAYTVSKINQCPLQASLEQSVSDRESALVKEGPCMTEHDMWLYLEDVRLGSWWLPYCDEDGDQEDPDRQVPFSMVQSILVTVHGPCNLSMDGPPAALVSRRAKQRLVLLWLNSVGVWHPRVSLEHGLSPATVRRQQLAECDAARSLAELGTHGRQSLAVYAARCLEMARSLFPDDCGPWRDDLVLLDLAHQVRAQIAAADQWKEALVAVRHSAKAVLAGATSGTGLWISYAELLLSLTEHRLFRGCDRGTRALVAEAAKVVDAVVVQAMSSPGTAVDQCLAALSLAVTVATDKAARTSTVAAITAIVRQAATVLARHHGINEPQQSLSSLCLLLTEVTDHPALSGQTTPTIHWHRSLFFLSLSTLLLVDIEPFMSWMSSACLEIITKLGSSCNWSTIFVYQLSQYLESTSSFFAWYLRGRDLNDCAHLRSVLSPFLKTMSEIQTSCRHPITDLIFSPRLIQLCIGQGSLAGCQTLSVRNFLWDVVSCSETETTTVFNYVCHGSSLLLLNMELRRWSSMKDGCEGESSSGRADRVRSTYNRLLALRCMHWRHRLSLWLSLMHFESDEALAAGTGDEPVKAVFYRAVTEMAGQKSLYLAIVALVPSIVEEVTALMKGNGLRLCVPMEEVKLLLRIRESSRPREATAETSRDQPQTAETSRDQGHTSEMQSNL